MSACPTCGYPMVWSTDRARPICCVYGDHHPPIETTPARLILLDSQRRERVA